MKKMLAMITLVGFTLSTIGVNAATVMNKGKQIQLGDETYAATKLLYKNGITKLNVEQQDFWKPSQRWEAALLMKRFNKKVKKNLPIIKTNCSFGDISKLDHEIQSEIIESCSIGLFQGNLDVGTFMPHDKFTRGQTILVFSRMISKNKKPFLGGSYMSQINNAYDYLLKKKIINVDDRHDFERPVTREEIYLMMYRIIKSNSSNKGQGKKPGSTNLDLSIIEQIFNSTNIEPCTASKEDPNKEVNLNESKEKADEILKKNDTDYNIVSFADDKTYNKAALPVGGSRIILQKVGIRNNQSSPLTIDTVNFDLKGLISYSSISKVYLLDEDQVDSSTGTINSNYEGKIHPRRGLKTIESGKTKYYYIAIDTKNDESLASSTFRLQYTFNFQDPSNAVGGNITHTTKDYRFVAYTTQTLTVEGYNTPATKIYVGDTQKLIGEFTLDIGSANSNSNRLVELDKIILTNEGVRIEDKLENVVLKDQDGRVISKNAKVLRDKITADFVRTTDVESNDNSKNNGTKEEKLTFERGDSMRISIYADITGGSNNDKISFYLRNDGDLIATEKGTQLPVKVNTIGHKYFKEFEIQAGKIVISRYQSPIVETISANSGEKEVLRTKISNPSSFELNNLKVFGKIRNNNSQGYTTADELFRSVKLYTCSEDGKNCKVVDTMNVPNKTINAGNTEDVEFKASLNQIKKGSTILSLRVQTNKFAQSNIDFSFEINKNSFEKPVNSQDDYININSIVGSSSSNFWSIGSNKISVNYMNNEVLEFVKGKSGVSGGEIVLSSNNIQSLRLNNLTLKFESNGTDVNLDQINNVRLVGEGFTSESRDVESNGNVNFDSLNIRIEKGKQLRLKVVFDLSTSLYAADGTKTLKFSIPSANDILLTTGTGNKVKSADIGGLPLTSNTINIHSSGSIFVYKKFVDNKDEKNIIFDYNKYSSVLDFKIKSKYDDLRIKDLYVVSFTGNYSNDSIAASSIVTDTSNYINQIQYISGNEKVESSMINGIAKFENLSTDVKANEEKEIKLFMKPNNINDVSSDNKVVKIGVVFKLVDSAGTLYKTKFISLSNGEVLPQTNVNWNDKVESKEIKVRKTMIEVDSVKNSSMNGKISNGSDHILYTYKVTNKGSTLSKIKQFAFPMNITNSGNPLVLNSFKLEYSLDGGNSFTNWNQIEDRVEFAAKLSSDQLATGDWGTSNVTSITEAANNQYMLYARFVGDYKNGIELSGKNSITFRIKANIAGSDNTNDSIKVEFKESKDPATDGGMFQYVQYEQGDAAKSTIIWSDNADSNSNTQLDHMNWFEDQFVIGKSNSYTLNYKN